MRNNLYSFFFSKLAVCEEVGHCLAGTAVLSFFLLFLRVFSKPWVFYVGQESMSQLQNAFFLYPMAKGVGWFPASDPGVEPVSLGFSLSMVLVGQLCTSAWRG